MHPRRHHHLQLQLRLCPKDWGDSDEEITGVTKEDAKVGQTLSGIRWDLPGGASQLFSRDIPDKGPETPALPQPQVSESNISSATVVREYVTEPSRVSKSRAELRREMTSLKEKKLTMLVENLRSGNFEVLES
ncbi:hypothetical protein Tco_0492142 [Tanacetum coccineum]